MQPFKLVPNIRWEAADATSGYTWGKPFEVSKIIAGVSQSVTTEYQQAIESIPTSAIVAERWISSDDQQLGSVAMTDQGIVPLRQLLEEYPEQLLGSNHLAHYGSYLSCVMKLLDTHPKPTKGSLSVQIHPKPGHPTRPAKPEMWLGSGSVYLGWKNNVSSSQIETAINESNLESLMNQFDLDQTGQIIVPGCTIHAIRYNSFLCEWSLAPGKADQSKGGLKDATVALYDRTDGKTPRPNKENITASLELLSACDGFKRFDQSVAQSKPVTLVKESGCTHQLIFTTPEVLVEQLDFATIDSKITLQLEQGRPLFCEQGVVEITTDQTSLTLSAGEEAYLPAACQRVTLQSIGSPAKLFNWYAPLE